jgi:hypothetical protein
VDPLAEIYQGFSPYNYTLNNPTKYIDPNGMWVENADSYSTNDPDEIRAFFKSKQNSSQEGFEGDCCPKNTGSANRNDKDANYQFSTSISLGAQAGFNINNIISADLNLASTPLLHLRSGRENIIDHPMKYENYLTINQEIGISALGFGISETNNFKGD